MGYPGKNTKEYETPNHPFQGGRIQDEHRLVEDYGLKNKRELWDAQSDLRGYRREARRLLGQEGVEEEREQVVSHLQKLGILGQESTLDDILGLDETDILERRLQTVVYRKGFANTIEQARQFINHGHISVGRKKVTTPGYKVEVEEEGEVGFYGNSPLADELHPERANEEQ